jgi:hypothetical protein
MRDTPARTDNGSSLERVVSWTESTRILGDALVTFARSFGRLTLSDPARWPKENFVGIASAGLGHRVSSVKEETRRSLRTSLDALFLPDSVALIGATERAGTVGRTILENLQHPSFRGGGFMPSIRVIPKSAGSRHTRALARFLKRLTWRLWPHPQPRFHTLSANASVRA